jgi:hypothetical protein
MMSKSGRSSRNSLSRPEEVPFPAAGDIAPNLSSSEPTQLEETIEDEGSRRSNGDVAHVREGSSRSRRISDGSTAVIDVGTSGEPADLTDGSRAGNANELAFPPTHRVTTTSSGKPYSSFSKGMKWMIVTLAGIAGVFSPIRFVSSFVFRLDAMKGSD